MLFDPVLNSLNTDSELQMEPGGLNKPLRCAHCYMPIKGRYHQSGKDFYDDYCWQFRYVIDPILIEKGSRKTAKDYDDDGSEI
jgi:hypothetical protein